MRFVAGVLILALGVGAGVAADRLLLRPSEDAEVAPGVADTDPGPGDPPLVWLEGTLEELGEDELVVRDGDGPLVHLERFAGSATRFFALAGTRWEQLEPGEVEVVQTGQESCVEALLDGETFLAVRVFLGSGCGPV